MTAPAAAECGPGDAPIRPLPDPGVQPHDPATAEAQIRERHALLVDMSVPFADKPADLLDDRTGVQDATARLDIGQFADVAKTASYTIAQVVFTAPDQAWFRYTITTSTSTFADRFGVATFNGAVWQITRDDLPGPRPGGRVVSAGAAADRTTRKPGMAGCVGGMGGPRTSTRATTAAPRSPSAERSAQGTSVKLSLPTKEPLPLLGSSMKVRARGEQHRCSGLVGERERLEPVAAGPGRERSSGRR